MKTEEEERERDWRGRERREIGDEAVRVVMKRRERERIEARAIGKIDLQE